LNDRQDGFADGGADGLAIDAHSHIRTHQWLDIEGSVYALHCDCSSVKGSGEILQLHAALHLAGHLTDKTGRSALVLRQRISCAPKQCSRYREMGLDRFMLGNIAEGNIDPGQ
jgi:hypothetical protein